MQVDEIAKQRFESFKLGLPSTTAPAGPQHRHRRSHSRNASISSTASLPTPKCTTTYDVPPTQSLPPPPKRNSHHRRVSSVSTRRESAEMMGVSVAETKVSPAEDPVERDSIRRHALWALEGKRDDASYTKVEIPELPTPFEFPSKPSFPPGSGAFMNTAKRDSFKPSLSKDMLHTLVEEEEEEEDSDKPRAPPTPTTPTTTAFVRNSSRPRPAQLSLRPLSLTPDNLPSLTPPSHNLPTPPSPRRLSLKSLTLTPDATISHATVMNQNTSAPSPTPLRPRPVLNIKMSAEVPAPSSGPLEEASGRPQPPRRSSISYKTSSTTVTAGLPTPEATPTSSDRRFSGFSHNSISSRGSLSSTSSRISATEDDFLNASTATRPLSVSEQHFLFKSHNALLARITDLERALSFRNNGGNFRELGSRPSSVASAVSAVSCSSSSDESTGEPIDEMLRLVTDLKAERDELKRDVEGWRVRVGDMDKQLEVLGNRLEVERRDAWVARTRVGLVEVERSGLEKRVGELESENKRLMEGEEKLKEQVARLLEEKEKMAAELQEAKATREMDLLSTPRAFDGPVVAVRPVPPTMKRGLGFTSLDSESSATDVEDGGFQPFGLGLALGFKLRAVEEEVGDDDDDSGLAGYEDEDENDVLVSPSSSFGSLDELHPAPRVVLEAPQPAPVPAAATYRPISNWTFPKGPQPAPAPVGPAPAHVNRPSISKWTFPRGAQLVERQVEEEVDRFFGCLEDLDNLPSPSSPKYLEYDEEKAKGMFSKGFGRSDDTKSCFVLPASVLASAESTFCELDVVEEEDEEEEEDDADEGETEGETVVEDGEINNGIKITFTPPDDAVLEAPPAVPISPPSPSPSPVSPAAFIEDEDEEEVVPVPFNFGRPLTTPERPTAIATPSTSVNSRPISPSSIPRPTTSKPAHFTPASPPRPVGDMNFVTPPTKRGGTMPSFIPQPTSPSRTNSQKSPPPFATNASTKPSTTFIRQPARQPLMPKLNSPKTQHTNGSAIPKPRPSDAAPHSTLRYAIAHPGSDMKSVDLSDRNIPAGPSAASCSNTSSVPVSSSFSSIMSSPLAGRLSFQTLTNYIPSWGMTQAPLSDAAGHNSSGVTASPAGTVKRGYVSKQSQLERLKSRLEREGLDTRSAIGKKSDSNAVFL
ncbi:hypothetical protein MSAN_01417200 [Mycena sanguinolenta]|uniref:Uncharacterized protein n=1 Tax=Mycena sanguinolenta TaxID=230812 RepID=A0A8H7D0K3_9AGAR|nr:hypothetical protein MSAN_01417200 [Mycena sanguinolenta]